MERNRRIAKAYARKHQLTVNGSEDEYLDGTTLGLNSFDNPDMDSKTRHIKQYIGQGLRIKITKGGDILVKRLSEANVFVHRQSTANKQRQAIADEQNTDYAKSSNSSSDPYASEFGGVYGVVRPAISQNQRLQHLNGSSKFPMSKFSDRSSSVATKRTGGSITTALGANYKSVCLEQNKVVKIFDMAKFKQLLEYESKQTRPNRNYLRNQCISVISFVVDDKKLLNIPSWIMIINIVALDLFREELGFSSADLPPHPMLTMPSRATDYLDGQAMEEADNMDNELDELNLNRHQELFSKGSLSASKQAFARAAAEGAYNDKQNEIELDGDNEDDDYEVTGQAEAHSDGSDGRHLNDMGYSRHFRQNKLRTGGSESNIKGKFAPSSSDIGLTTSESKPATQQSSSSSGFDSHCSSQQNSSAASSNSNIASSPNVGATNQQQTSSVLKAVQDLESGKGGQLPMDGLLTGRQAPRGLKPAKLPHRLNGEFVSDPIEIPAPPSEPATKANLILVSPTGLSPPKQTQSQQIDFKTIKHIDEEGKCKILYDKNNCATGRPEVPMRHQARANKPQLPAGIPAHAQLAPPATQRHILRYLMSVNQNRLVEAPTKAPLIRGDPIYDISNQSSWQQQQQPPARPARLTSSQLRPLPILPHQNRAKQPLQHRHRQTDEGLYYSGLQARISQARPQMVVMHNHHLANSKQVSAIKQVQQQQQSSGVLLREIRQKQSSFGGLMNKPAAYRLAKSTNNITASHQEELFNNMPMSRFDKSVQNENRKQPAKSSFTRPLAKLFKASPKAAANEQLSPITRGKFTSADNLLTGNRNNAQKQQQQQSVWSQLGLAIDSSFRSKMRKSKSSTKLTTSAH